MTAEEAAEQKEPEPADKDEPSDQDTFAKAQERASDPASADQWNDQRSKLDAARQWLGGGGTTNVFFGGVGQVGDTVGAVAGTMVNSGPVSGAVLDRVRASYVEPTRYTDLRRVLQSHQVLVINAPSGTGRTTTALRLLDELCVEGVLKLDPDTVLKTLDDKTFTGLHGYLLDRLDRNQSRELSLYHLERLSAVLRRKGCMLVVITEQAVPLPAGDIEHLVAVDLGAVEPRQLLERHLAWVLEQSPTTAAEPVLSHPEVGEVLGELTKDVSRSDLAKLGDLLAEVATGQVDIGAVRERYSHNSRASFVDWFDHQIDLPQRAFVIALAVFNDEPVQLVSRAATRLADMLAAVAGPRRATRGRPLFDTPLATWIERARAEVVDGVEDTTLGAVAVRKARFRDDSYPARVLEHLCAEYDQAFTVVADWLNALGGDGGGRVRVRAGMAVGFLSRFDFIGIHDGVVLRWASTGDQHTRDAAVAALQLPAEHPALSRVVRTLLRNWIRDRSEEGWSRRQVAVRALGTTVAVSTDKALDLLRLASRYVDWETAYLIGESVSDLMCRVEEPVTVLDALVAWSDAEQYPLRRETALLSTLIAGAYLTVLVAESTEKWPALVWLAEQHDNGRASVTTLYARMLQSAHFIDRGYEQLRGWVRLAQKDETLRVPVARLLADIAVEADDVASMRHYARTWAKPRGGPAKAVGVVLEHLEERVDHGRRDG
ncbi:ATP-binding protein [Actinokineospora diospyrosa]|uniref:AAA+ ATPase domain-containing protein n=1 Tax=Actinokineospora diospyrosa TaxID=103728 RepID=A0ABT1IMN5_9PSEU|nr:ATP-binding protein [Actinokineospora diospyrosa]MCP2273905.1 hypothetical protein [Actinokineospora diospyrosa]